MQYPQIGPRWYEGLSVRHWMVLAVASAGWVFDVYEGQLFTIFKTPMLTDLTGGSRAAVEWQGNLGLAAFLFGGAVGGLGFGVLGDRLGRARVMAYTILVYSVFSALTAFATSTFQEACGNYSAPHDGDHGRFWGLALATIGLATYWGIFAWGPELVALIAGDTVSAGDRQEMGSRAYLLMNFTGGLLGLLCFAPLASWRGRRFAFAVYHLGAAIVAPAAFLGAGTYAQALWLLPLMAFFVLGMHAGYAIYFPELFPTRLRATGWSVCFNMGRVLGAGILIVRGTLGSAMGLRWAAVALSGLFWLGLVILIFGPETTGRELPE